MNNTFRRPAFWAVATTLALWPNLLFRRLYDPDELEHLHAAYSIANGLLPYRDFFEHHGPLTYFLTAPFVKLFGSSPDLLHLQRGISFAFVLLLIWGVADWLGQLGIRRPWFALGWLLTFPWFMEKAVEGRPDVPAAAFLVLAGSATLRAASGKVRWAFLAGVSLAIASLFTQKSAFLSIGIVLGGAVTSSARRTSWRLSLLAGGLGFLVPWVVVSLYFLGREGFIAFFDRVVVLPLHWPAHVPKADEGIGPRLFAMTGWSPGHLVFALLAALTTLLVCVQRRPLARGDSIALFGCLLHFAALPITPAAYLQFYLLALPFAAVLIGRAAPLIFRRHHTIAAICLISSVVIGWTPLFPVQRILVYWTADVITSAVVAVFAIAWAATLFRPALRRAAVVGLTVTCLAVGAARVGIQHLYWNAAEFQRRDLIEFERLTSGPVLDGFTGLGCLHPHASYWWWINHHSIPLMRREGAMQGVLELVRARIPDVVVFDENIRLFGGGLISVLEAGYNPVQFHQYIIWRRKPRESAHP